MTVSPCRSSVFDIGSSLLGGGGEGGEWWGVFVQFTKGLIGGALVEGFDRFLHGSRLGRVELGGGCAGESATRMHLRRPAVQIKAPALNLLGHLPEILGILVAP